MPPRHPCRPHRSTVPAAIAGLAVLVLAGCGSSPAVRTEVAPPPPDDLFVDWDHHDWMLDRFVLASARRFAPPGADRQTHPWRAYRQALTYTAPWDSLGLVAFINLSPAEQHARRDEAAAALGRARRAILSTIHAFRYHIDDGLEPRLADGAGTAVITALGQLVNAAGVDPSHPGAWRDLAYFHGVVGDRPRQQRALASCLAALDQLPAAKADAADAHRVRRDVLLDLAWLARDLGQPAVTIAYLDYLEPWLATPGREREERLYEAQVLRGLALADQGEWLAAVTRARDLPSYDVTTRTLPGGAPRDDLRWVLTAPHFATLGFDRAAWPTQRSDFGRRWIKALAGAPSGFDASALWLLGAPPTHLEFPPRLAARFWQDQGRLHGLAGDHETAARCYEWAARYRPYAAFVPVSAHDHSPRGGPGYFLGFGRFFLCGDREAYDRDLAQLVAQRARTPGIMVD
jgi:tetratricopeptide (TPR) repeat protein